MRAAEAALRALNRSDIAGKRIKLEPSRPGGTRRKCVIFVFIPIVGCHGFVVLFNNYKALVTKS